MSESDPFVVVAKYAATAQDLFEHTVAEMSEFRKANSTLFTAQVCGASLVMAFISSFFSGFTLAFLVSVLLFLFLLSEFGFFKTFFSCVSIVAFPIY